jgi:hypothetical protein
MLLKKACGSYGYTSVALALRSEVPVNGWPKLFPNVTYGCLAAIPSNNTPG